MKEKKAKKSNKNLYIPDFVAEILDREGELYGGPGVAAAAAILAFSELGSEEKKKAYESFRAKEIGFTFADKGLSAAQDAKKSIPSGRTKDSAAKSAKSAG